MRYCRSLHGWKNSRASLPRCEIASGPTGEGTGASISAEARRSWVQLAFVKHEVGVAMKHAHHGRSHNSVSYNTKFVWL